MVIEVVEVGGIWCDSEEGMGKMEAGWRGVLPDRYINPAILRPADRGDRSEVWTLRAPKCKVPRAGDGTSYSCFTKMET